MANHLGRVLACHRNSQPLTTRYQGMDHEKDEASNGSVQKVHLSGDLWDYGSRDLMSGVTIQAAAATFIDKREDRHCVSFGNKEMEECQLETGSHDAPRMAAYLAVFDGHDGPRASEYCYKGLLPHILSETRDANQKENHSTQDKEYEAIDGSKVESPLDAAIINAFHHAQTRFGNGLSPPTFEDVKKGVKATRYGNKGKLARIYSKAKQRRKPNGGTTALTLMIYGKSDDGSKETISLDPVPHAVVANTGDCRLLTDDGLGSHEYRQVTTDHRPEDPGEHDRLVKRVQQGHAVLGREVRAGTLRVYPGGLAVSRSLGDLSSSKAIICTPEIFRVPIAVCEGKTRLVLASDGLLDVMTNQQIGEIVARVQKKEEEDSGEETIVSPGQAASKLMEECLKNGGHLDDVTILVVDVSYSGNSAKASKNNA